MFFDIQSLLFPCLLVSVHTMGNVIPFHNYKRPGYNLYELGYTLINILIYSLFINNTV